MKTARLFAIGLFMLLTSLALPTYAAESFKVHGIFRSNMVIQRDKPIKIWGWATPGTNVFVRFGENAGATGPADEDGRWELTFDARPASTKPLTVTISCGDDKVVLDNILIGDIWVMNGQSNMAFALKAVYRAPFESAQAHLPLMRTIKINAGAESEHREKDLDEAFINGNNESKDWQVVTPEVALQMGAIGYIFGSNVQRATQIPIGIIDNSRGGASLESLVPRHKFAEDPQAKAYLAWVDERNAAFSEEDFLAAQMEKYEQQLARYNEQVAKAKAKGEAYKGRKPNKPDGSIRTWSVPGRSPSDAASCYNGMFGVFKGLNIKGVAFHQGFNNAMMNTSCKPVFYRTLMKLMVQGWREDFNDPHLPVAVIGLCAGGQAQTALNFETQGLSTGAYIREAQRLGLADVGDPKHTAFIPAYDQKIPQLHTKKKAELGIRTARWALKSVYGFEDIVWESAELESVERQGGAMLLTFDKPVRVDDFGSQIVGFSIAGDNGVFYMANAVAVDTKDKAMQHRQLLVSSPLVKAPSAVRYAWARAPMGNLMVNGMPWQPLASFRTDAIDWAPEVSHMDPDGPAKNGAAIKELKAQAAEALKTRLDAQGN